MRKKLKMGSRKSMGKEIPGIVIPVAPLAKEMDKSYHELRDCVIERIKYARIECLSQANSRMIVLYWEIGNEIMKRQEAEGWGAGVIDRLSEDLREAFPEMGGFSARNLGNMKRFAVTWVNPDLVQGIASKLPWRSIISLTSKIATEEERVWYAKKSLQHGWSSNVLNFMIDARLIEREGKATTNFENALPPIDSDMAVQAFKDPYLFDFVGTDGARREAEIENSLIAHMEKFLLELGQGFAYVGRQVHLEVGDEDFFIDLLFYHLKLRCFVVIELKARDFEPGDVSQLSMYQNIVNKVFRHETDKPTIGLLLVKGKNKTVVEYSLEGYQNPIGVADWHEELPSSLTDALKPSLPTIEEIEREFESTDFATGVAKLDERIKRR